MFTLSLMLLIILVLAVLLQFQFLYPAEKKQVMIRNLLLGLIYIGSFAIVWGILAQGIGIYQALSAIQAAGDISPAIIIGGIKVSMITPFYGTFIFLFSSLLWFAFKLKYNSVYPSVLKK